MNTSVTRGAGEFVVTATADAAPGRRQPMANSGTGTWPRTSG